MSVRVWRVNVRMWMVSEGVCTYVCNGIYFPASPSIPLMNA